MRRREFLIVLGASLGSGIVLSGCGGGDGGSVPPPPPGGGGGVPAPNAFRFTEVLNSANLQLPERSGDRHGQNRAEDVGMLGRVFASFTGSVILTKNGSIFFDAMDAEDRKGSYELVLDTTQSPPVPVALRRLVAEGDTLPDGRVVTDIGIGDANKDGKFATVISTHEKAPGVYVRDAGGEFQPLFNLMDLGPGNSGYVGGAFGDLSLNDNGDLLVVAKFTPPGTVQSQQGVYYLDQGDPASQDSFLVMSTGVLGPDMALVPTDGISMVQINEDGGYVAQTGVTVTPTPAPVPQPVPPAPVPPVDSPDLPDDAALTSLAFNPPGLTLLPNSQARLRAFATAEGNPQPYDVSSLVVWQSDNPDLVTVDAQGTLAASTSTGLATVTAALADHGLMAAAVIDVRNPEIWVVDSTEHNILRLDGTTGAVLDSTPAKFGANPGSLALDSSGRIHLTDRDQGSILRIDDLQASNPVRLEPGEDTFGFADGVFVDGSGRIYVMDNSRKQVVRFDDMSGAGRVAFGGADVFEHLLSVFVAAGPAGRVYVTTLQSVVSMDDMTGANLQTLSSPLNPGGVFAEPGGRLYVCDFGGASDTGTVDPGIYRFDDMTGANPVRLPADQPQAVFLDVHGRIHYTDGGRLHRVDDIGGANPVDLTGSLGFVQSLFVAPFVAPTPADSGPLPDEDVVKRGSGRGTVLVTGNVKRRGSLRLAAASGRTAVNPALRALHPRDGGIVPGEPALAGRIASSGAVAAVVTLEGGVRALYVDGVEVIRTGALSPHGHEIASLFAPVVSGPAGLVYFQLTTVAGLELCLWDGSATSTILSRGDLLNGKTVETIIFGMMRDGVDSDGRLALQVEFQDGTTSIVVAEPV